MKRLESKTKPVRDNYKEETGSRLYSEILRRIVSEEYCPGQRLVEEELAQSFKVSRTPIREVLIKLERDGLVYRVPNQGAKVAAFTPDDLEHIYEIRKALECLAVRNAAKLIKLNDLFELERQTRQLLQEMTETPSDQWIAHYFEKETQLHGMIAQSSGNPRLVSYLETLTQLIHSVRYLSRDDHEQTKTAIEEHLKIIEALKHRNADEAELLMAAHIDASVHHAITRLFP